MQKNDDIIALQIKRILSGTSKHFIKADLPSFGQSKALIAIKVKAKGTIQNAVHIFGLMGGGRIVKGWTIDEVGRLWQVG